MEQFQDMKGIIIIADDRVVYGTNREEHDRRLHNLLQKCQTIGVKLNPEKLAIGLDAITFMGHRITNEGIVVDPEKVRAITDMPIPRTLGDLRKFLGVINYVGKFILNLTTVRKPLQDLTKKDVMWTWSESQQSSFNMTKDLISRVPVLSYYNPLKELTLENDACEYGLEAARIQEEQRVANASCSLSDIEKRYAQIEKEMVAVVHGLEKFHHYTHGRKVNVFIDHKPLVSICQKPLAKAPKLLPNLLLRAQQYDFSIKYKPGKEIPQADALSRAPTDKPEAEELMIVNNLTMHPIKDRSLSEIRSKILEDPIMKILAKVIATGWPSDKRLLPDSLKPFFDYGDELTAQDGLILRRQNCHPSRHEIRNETKISR